MNVGLKSLIKSIADIEQLVVDSISKQMMAALLDCMALPADAASDISSWSQLQSDVKGLSNPVNLQDLISYVESQFQNKIPGLSGSKAQSVTSALIALVRSAIALEQAFV